jgi:hypothetical protein
MKKIIRVFPRRTNATPTDEDVRINSAPGLFDECDEVHISCTFTWDIRHAEWLAKQWQPVATVKVGGVAFGSKGGDFVPGMYLEQGYVITSRGCPNRCSFCSVPIREGNAIRELPITDGYNVLDDNILATSEEHFNAVIKMLKRQKNRPIFSGGLEAKILTADRAKKILNLNPKEMFFAYDTPNDYEPLVAAGKMLKELGYKRESRRARCYVLINYKNDNFEKAEKRLLQAWSAGFFPMAMLYRDHNGFYQKGWKQFQREWASPIIVGYKLKQLGLLK